MDYNTSLNKADAPLKAIRKGNISVNAMTVLVIKYAVLITLAVMILFPLTIVLLTSFKTEQEYISTSVFQLPKSFLNFDNFRDAFVGAHFLNAFIVSLKLVVISTAINVLFGTMTAYCLNRFTFPLNRVIKFLYSLSAIVPGVTLQISIYKLFAEIHLKSFAGPLAAPILIYAATDIVQIWIYLQYMEKIPVSLDESAMIDGASYFRIFRSIIFPLLMPATATVIIIKAIGVYNDMFTQYLYLTGSSKSISTALNSYAGIFGGTSQILCAGIVLVMIPNILIFLFLQKYIFEGLTVGAIKE
jgi:raffinose/stachyose/melibiose transport system permease protein